jgi:hypothetical protein
MPGMMRGLSMVRNISSLQILYCDYASETTQFCRHLTCTSKDHWERKQQALPDTCAEQMNVETESIIEN